MVKWHGGAGGIGVTIHDVWFDPFEMRLWGLASCCDLPVIEALGQSI